MKARSLQNQHDSQTTVPCQQILTPLKKENIAAVLWGNTMEYFDSLMYVHMMVIITPLFFPSNSPTALSLLAVTGFSVNYLARPVGALIFGLIGDKLGRRIALYISILMMLLATGFIGVLPVYAQAGISASIALLILRFFQGLSCSGEASGALIYLMESAPKEQRYFYSALYNATIILGGVIAALIISFSLSFLSADHAWRYPFQIAAIVGIVGLLMRYQLTETPEFQANKERKNSIKLRQLILRKKSLKNILKVASFSSFDAATFWVTYVFMSDLLKKYVGLQVNHIVLHNGAIMLFQIFTGMLLARFASEIGWKKLGQRAILALIFVTIPLFLLMEATSYPYIILTVVQLFVISCGNAFVIATDPLRVFLFPVIGRFIGMAFGVALGRVLGYVIGGYLLVLFNYWFGSMGAAIYLLMFAIPVWWAVKTITPEEEAIA